MEILLPLQLQSLWIQCNVRSFTLCCCLADAACFSRAVYSSFTIRARYAVVSGGGACGYGVYREGCEYVELWNAWKCTNASSGGVTPARLIIESMDADHTSRSLTPVALASGGYVDLLNGGWDHQAFTH